MASSPDFSNLIECSICLEKLDNPKRLACDHHFCKACVDDILKFQSDGSAIIHCPKRCAETTHIGVKQTTNDLRVSCDFKQLLEAVKQNNDAPTTRCQYTNNCEREVVVYCCGLVMCRPCNIDHETQQQHHPEKTSVYFDNKENEMKVLCHEHMTGCTYICEDEEFLCIYCLHRRHQNHAKDTIDSKAASVRQAIVNDSGKVNNITESLRLTEIRMLDDEKKFERALIERKTACLLGYLNFLNEEETVIKKKFKDLYMGHTQEYPSPNPPEYYANNLLKTNTQLVVEIDNIIRSLAKTNISSSSQLRHATVNLSEDFNFHDAHPLGELQVELGNEVSFSHPATATFKGVVAESNDYTNTVAKLKEIIDETLNTKVTPESKEQNAITAKQKKMVNECVTKLNERGIDYVRELFLAKENEKFRLLVAEKPGITKLRGRNNRTPVHLAAALNNVDALQLLVQNGASAEDGDSDGWTALHYAVYNNRAECVEWLLLHYNQLIDRKDTTDGNTPLHKAVDRGYLSSVKLLLKYGVNTNITNMGNKTPLQLAQQRGKQDCVKELIQWSRDHPTQ